MASKRKIIENKNGKHTTWMIFSKQISVLLNRNVWLQLRLKYFDACDGFAILFGISTLSIFNIQFQEFKRRPLECSLGPCRSSGDSLNLARLGWNSLDYLELIQICRNKPVTYLELLEFQRIVMNSKE